MFSLNRFLDVKEENRRLLAFTYYAFLCSGAMSTVLGAVLPSLSSEYALPYSIQGSLLSFHQVGNLLSVFLAGFLPYAIGRKKSTLIGGAGIILGLVFMTLWGNPFFLVFAFLLTGIGRGTFSNMTNVVVGDSCRNKTAGLNLLHASFAIGAFLSPLLALSVGSSAWRAPCWIISAFMLIALILLGTSSLSNGKTAKGEDGGRSFIKSPAFWLNTMIMFFYLCAEASLTGWLVTYFTDTGLFPQSLATSMQSLLWIMILVGRLACATLSSRVNKPTLILTLGLIMTAFFLVMINAASPVMAVIGVFGTGVSMSGIYPTTLSTMPGKYNSSTVATGSCIGIATIGGILMPIIIGLVADQTGDISRGIALILGALIIMLALMLTKLVLSKRGRV